MLNSWLYPLASSVHVNMGELWETYLLEKGSTGWGGGGFFMHPTAEVMSQEVKRLEQAIWNHSYTQTSTSPFIKSINLTVNLLSDNCPPVISTADYFIGYYPSWNFPWRYSKRSTPEMLRARTGSLEKKKATIDAAEAEASWLVVQNTTLLDPALNCSHYLLNTLSGYQQQLSNSYLKDVCEEFKCQLSLNIIWIAAYLPKATKHLPFTQLPTFIE